MVPNSFVRSAARCILAGLGLAAAGYATLAGVAWLRYGHVPLPAPEEADALLDRFMPMYEVVERHRVSVAAPAAVTLASAREVDLFQPPVVRAIFRARELALGARPDTHRPPRPFLDEMLSLGWRVLAEVPEREVVVGSVTKPWEATVTFRGLSAEEFAAFNEPGFVKIAWTLRADPVGAGAAIFRTETRVLATDADARARFRQYWSLASPGIRLIRWMSLAPIRNEAERRARASHTNASHAPAAHR